MHTSALASQIIEFGYAHGWQSGARVRAQAVANALGVSRTPVNAALAALAAQNILRHEPNRGYFLSHALPPRTTRCEEPTTNRAYFDLAEDLLRGALPETVTARALRQRYKLTASALQDLLARIAQEGWVTKKQGYGWAFSKMLTTPESLLQSYRLRLAVEPAALREPGYFLPLAQIEMCRQAELSLLNNGIDQASPDALHQRGVRFHETLVEGSGNLFFIETVRRVNRVRRLLSYRSMQDRSRYAAHCDQHLHILDLLAAGRNEDAAQALDAHLRETLINHEKLVALLSRAE